jgi:hypothetical protein
VFANVDDAVNAIEECFFGTAVDNNNESLESWYPKPSA